jgi:hypothetical protein
VSTRKVHQRRWERGKAEKNIQAGALREWPKYSSHLSSGKITFTNKKIEVIVYA